MGLPAEPAGAGLPDAPATAGFAAELRRSLRAIGVGVLHPMIGILFLVAFFDGISGEPVDGPLLGIAVVALARDTGLRRIEGSSGEFAALSEPTTMVSRLLAQPVLATALLVVFAVVVGGFDRFSWPASIAIVVVIVMTVAARWQDGPRREPPGPLPFPGLLVWWGVLAVGGLWELATLLQQPDLVTTSQDHPTISALADPEFVTHLWRSVGLAGWLFMGWFLVER